MELTPVNPIRAACWRRSQVVPAWVLGQGLTVEAEEGDLSPFELIAGKAPLRNPCTTNRSGDFASNGTARPAAQDTMDREQYKEVQKRFMKLMS